MTRFNAASAFGQNNTTVAPTTVAQTNPSNVTSSAALAYGGDLYLGSLLGCYLCIFLCRLLLTV